MRPAGAAVAERYLALLKAVLTGEWSRDSYRFVKRPKDALAAAIWDALHEQSLELVTREAPGRRLYEEGGGWPVMAQTMIGRERLNNLHDCIRTVLAETVPGDFIETGVWRGGATIFMRAALEAYGDERRRVWVADSFQGVPPPDAERWPADRGDRLHEQRSLVVSRDEVEENFRRYGLLDERVKFVEGWFRETLPALHSETWAVVRLDGDLYESTMDGLVNLYPRLSAGGYLIVDDFGAMPPCRQAVEDFRAEHGIDEPLEHIDWTGVYWRKPIGP